MLKDLLEQVLTKDEMKIVNKEVCTAPKFPTCRRPAAGLQAPKFEGKEIYYTMLYVPIALLALKGSRHASDHTILHLLKAIMGEHPHSEFCNEH